MHDEINAPSPWLTAAEAAARLRINVKTLYRAVQLGECRAARIGGGRALRFLAEWVDAYAISKSAIVEVTR